MSNMQELHDSRVADIIATSNHREPKVVPVLSNILTWAIGYAKGDSNELLDDLDKLPEVYNKFLEEV